MEVPNSQGLAKTYITTAAKHILGDLSDCRVGMHGINNFHAVSFLGYTPDGGKYSSHGFSAIFPSVSRKKYDPFPSCGAQGRSAVLSADRCAQSIYYGVSRNAYIVPVYSL